MSYSYPELPCAADRAYRDAVADVVDEYEERSTFSLRDLVSLTGLRADQVNRGIHYFRNVLLADRTAAFICNGGLYYLTTDVPEVHRYYRRYLRHMSTMQRTGIQVLRVVATGNSTAAKAARHALHQGEYFLQTLQDALED